MRVEVADVSQRLESCVMFTSVADAASQVYDVSMQNSCQCDHLRENVVDALILSLWSQCDQRLEVETEPT